ALHVCLNAGASMHNARSKMLRQIIGIFALERTCPGRIPAVVPVFPGIYNALGRADGGSISTIFFVFGAGNCNNALLCADHSAAQK
ncbi:MAG: hypothetical protein P4K94_05395, partial [Terracidiphilus sp.]|nr:hypothetical protein [Terracidiphilus sp.]